MKIAILTSGILPVPAVQGGAVESLVDSYLEYNDQHRLHDITIYSVWHPDVEKHPAARSEVNHYHYIKVNGLWNKVKKKTYQYTHQGGYYHYTIEYFLEQTIKHIKKQQYDVIILENRPGYALKLKKVTNARLVYHLHNENLTVKVPQCLPIYDAAARIITVSNYIKSCVVEINPNDKKTMTVYNGINLNAFSRPLINTKRSSMGINDKDFILIYSGRVNKEKGILQLIEAISILKEYSAMKLMVIGSSFFGNDVNENSFICKLKAIAEPLGDRIIFTGFVPYAKMPDYLHIADVAVIPSIWDDPFPTTVLEALAMGLPIITTRRGGIPEEVTEENAIMLATDEHFVDNLATAILDLYHHPDKRHTMSKAARKRALLFSKERYARDFFNAINTL
ncbi:MAG: glycosyltransferase family 4 protein [Prevotella sp.]|nr:glycosyltransferase family 4 protein [Prevotella sp.]